MQTHALIAAKKRFSRGYTLVELAIVMVVIGVVMAGFALAYKTYAKNQEVQTTGANNSAVEKAIGRFLAEQGRYPCPAAIDLSPDNPRYGMETNCDEFRGYDATGAESAPVSVGYFGGGIWVEDSVRPPPAAPGTVVRGMIPFQALNIPEHQAYDGFGSRLQYAITTNLTVSETYDPEQGGIEIVDANDASMVTPPASAHFVIFSTGEDKMGGYSRFGKEQVPCGSGLDAENCNTEDDNKAVYRAAQYAAANGGSHFDDRIVYSSSTETPLWRPADASGYDIRDVNKDKIVIGTNAASMPDSSVNVDVMGTARAAEAGGASTDSSQGNLIADEFCESDGTGCFQAKVIADEVPAMDCSTGAQNEKGAYMSGIKNNEARCTDNTNLLMCPEAHYMAGINSNGTPICINIDEMPPTPTSPTCPATYVQHCSTDYMLPVGNNGQTHKTSKLGFNLYVTYTCEAKAADQPDKWVWKKTSQTGSCDCVAVDTVEETSCQTFKGTGYWKGLVKTPITRVCENNEIKETRGTADSSACLCDRDGYKLQTKKSCPSGMQASGTSKQTFERTWTCSTDKKTGSWSGDVALDQCVCVTGAPQVDKVCPSGTTGSRERTRTQSCPDPTKPPVWGPWVENTAAYNCTGCPSPAPVEYKEEDCASGYSGKIVYKRTEICSSSSKYWSGWSVESNTCTKICNTSEREEQTVDCPAGQIGSIVQYRYKTCPSDTWGPWQDYSNGCSTPPPPPPCDDTSEIKPEACPPGSVGTRQVKYNYKCVNGVRESNGWSIVSSDCQPSSFKWKTQGSPSGVSSSPIGPKAGDSCSPQGATGTCYAPIGSGQVENYNSCKCE